MAYKISELCFCILDKEIQNKVGYDKFMIPDEQITLYNISSEQARVLNKGKDIDVGWNYAKNSKLTAAILAAANKDMRGEHEFALDDYRITWEYKIL